MLIKWAFGDTCEIEHTVSNIFNIKNDYSRCDDDDYSKVFILNMIPTFEVGEKVVVFSKAETQEFTYKGKVDVSSSTTLLICKFFKKALKDLSSPQVELMRVIDSMYIDGAPKQDAMKLNAIFSYGRNKYGGFHERFLDGLDGYTEREDQIIINYKQALAKSYKAVEVFEHGSNKGVYIALVPDMYHKHEILDLLFKKLSPKIVFLADLANGFVSVRKDDSLDMDMHKICGSLLEGRALKNCAGGRYTEKFMDFSKAFV